MAPYKLSMTKPYKLITGDSLAKIKTFPKKSIDCVVTSPPYWNLREYDKKSMNPGALIGNEKTPEEYVKSIRRVFLAVKRVLKNEGSAWINMGDSYVNKNLVGMPWHVAFGLQQDGWILRGDIIWNKKTLAQSAKDRFRTMHEYVFHFVKNKQYYFDRKAVLEKHEKVPSKRNDGEMISITGVSGEKYRKYIKTTRHLTVSEKQKAIKALNDTIGEMKAGKINDFRMQIRGSHRVLNSDNSKISGRAKELKRRGFFIKTQKTEGHLPANIWGMVPEYHRRTDAHCAVYPVGLMNLPIRATCPSGGIVLDPFVGTGTSIITALNNRRRAVGIDVSQKYIKISKERVKKHIKENPHILSQTSATH